MHEILSLPFIQNAIVAAVLTSIACGIVGTLVVTNRLTFLAGGVAHAAYGGIGIAFACNIPVLGPAIGFSALSSMLMAGLMLRAESRGASASESTDTAIGVLWSAGMAFGIILIQLTPGYAADFMAFLFGSITAVPNGDLIVMLFFDVILLAVLGHFRQGIWAISIDKDYARARGIPVAFFFLLLVALIAVTVVLCIRVVGLIMVIALLTIPPFAARKLCRGLGKGMTVASLLSCVFCLVGLAISFVSDIAPGASIIAVASIFYFCLFIPDGVRSLKKRA